MGALQKAELVEISSDEAAKEGEVVPVQFNPTTLALKISNRTEGGEAQGRPSRQYIATSTTLTVSLVFDTADEGTAERPRSVRERTGIVEKFVLPRNQGTEVPPKLRFRWGDGMSFDGVVGEVNIDFDHFAHDGTPLRAQVALTLTEQDARYKVVPSSAKAKAPAPGAALPGGLGFSASASFSAGFSASASVALGGETAADFAARVGLDPTAWRGLGVDLSAGLTLEAGVEVGFDASLSAGVGLGASAGFGAGVDAPIEASFGLTPGGGGGSGFALSAAGGVGAAIEAVQVVKTAEAARGARQAFAASAPPESAALPASLPKPGLPEQSRAPLGKAGVSARPATTAAPRPPRVDPRAASWGYGVPLRPRIELPPLESTKKKVGGHHGKSCSCGCGKGGRR